MYVADLPYTSQPPLHMYMYCTLSFLSWYHVLSTCVRVQSSIDDVQSPRHTRVGSELMIDWDVCELGVASTCCAYSIIRVIMFEVHVHAMKATTKTRITSGSHH
jgi:hypothetical protein